MHYFCVVGMNAFAVSTAALSAHAPRKCIGWCDTLAEVSAPSARQLRTRTINARASLKRWAWNNAPTRLGSLALAILADTKCHLTSAALYLPKDLPSSNKAAFSLNCFSMVGVPVHQIAPRVFAHLIRTRLIQRANQWALIKSVVIVILWSKKVDTIK